MKNEIDQLNIDILLAAFFAGEASETEREAVNQWVNDSEENRRYFNASKKAWEAMDEAALSDRFNTETALQRVRQKINRQEEKNSWFRSGYAWVAAIVMIIGVASLFWMLSNTPGEVQSIVLASTGEVVYDTLPDGSIISLNRNSQITHPEVFREDMREVNLEGEAFFEVSRDTEHPFVIHAGMMDIKVLGTSFNVRAYPGGDSVHVSVHTGRVQCAVSGDTVVISEGEFAVYHLPSGKIVTGKEDDPNRAAYRDRIFRFNNTPLAIAVQQLNAAYGCNIILKNDALKNCTFSTTKVFYNEPVVNIIGTIVTIYPGITSHSEGNTIVLDGTGCY